MATTYNAYGQPNANYNQPARPRTPPQQNQNANPITQAMPPSGTGVQRDGRVDLNTAPPHVTGRYNNGDFDVGDAQTVLGNFYTNYLGHAAAPRDISAALRGQGLKPGDKYVGERGLNSVLQSLYQNHQPQVPVFDPANVPPSAMPGWDQTKWGNPNKHDAKYDAGRLMASLGAPTADNLQQVVTYLNAHGHQASFGGGDAMTVDGIPIDAIRDVGGPNAAWQWLAGGPQQQGVRRALQFTPSYTPSYAPNVLQDILASI